MDLNAASLEQLLTVPGIGKSTAQAIVKFRDQKGRFASVDELKQVGGVTDGGFELISQFVTVSRGPSDPEARPKAASAPADMNADEPEFPGYEYPVRWYKYILSDIEVKDGSKSDLYQTLGASPRQTGFSYIRNADQDVTGVVMVQSRSYIERQAGAPYFGAALNLMMNRSYLTEGLPFHVVESTEDRFTAKKTPDAKYRLKGKLVRVVEMSGRSKVGDVWP